jgi:hypothetical protein
MRQKRKRSMRLPSYSEYSSSGKKIPAAASSIPLLMRLKNADIGRLSMVLVFTALVYMLFFSVLPGYEKVLPFVCALNECTGSDGDGSSALCTTYGSCNYGPGWGRTTGDATSGSWSGVCCGDDSATEWAVSDDYYTSGGNSISWAGGTYSCCNANDCVSNSGTCYASTTDSANYGSLTYLRSGLNSGSTDNYAYCYGSGGADGASWLDCDIWYGSWCANTAVCGNTAGVYSGESVSFGEYTNQTALRCCGDDYGENYRSRLGGSDAPTGYTTDSSVYRCCNVNTDCVAGSTCTASTGTSGAIPTKAYCSSGTWYGGDYSSGACDAVVASGRYGIGGEVASTNCCGDDSGENYRTCVDSSANGACGADTTACCSASTDCIDASGSCQNTAACYTFSGSYKSYCNSGTWEDPDESSTYCTASGCGYTFLSYSDSGTGYGCCGDDLTNDNFDDSTPVAGQSCCYQGSVLTDGSTTGAFLCSDGALYSCNTGGTFVWDTDYTTGCTAVESRYCNADNTWKTTKPTSCACTLDAECTGYCDNEPSYGKATDTGTCFAATACGGGSANCDEDQLCQYDPSLVQACDDYQNSSCVGGDGYCSNNCAYSTLTTPTSPMATLNLSYSLNSKLGGINITFTDASNGESTFYVYRSTDNSTFSYLGSGSSPYRDHSLDDNTAYFYRVSAIKTGTPACWGTNTSTMYNITADRTAPAKSSVNATGKTTYVDLNWSEGDIDLVLYMPFEEGTGSSTDDWSAKANMGTLSGPTWIGGRYGNSLSYDAAYEKVTVANNPTLNIDSQITLMGWVNLTSDGSERFLITRYNYSNITGYSLGLTSAEIPVLKMYDGTTRRDLNTGTAIPFGEWTHLAGTYDGSTMKIYVNGVLRNSLSASFTPRNWNSDLQLGFPVDSAAAYNFLGQMDEVRFYNRSLSQREIINDMQSGTIKKGLFRALWQTGPYTQIGSINFTDNNYTDTSATDVTDPAEATSLSSISHSTSVWSKDNTVDFSWTTAADNGTIYWYNMTVWDNSLNFNSSVVPVTGTVTSGLDGYDTQCDTNSGDLATTTKDYEQGQTTHTCTFSDGSSNYFHIKSVDNVANWDDTSADSGPYYIDTVAPTVGQAYIESQYNTSNNGTHYFYKGGIKLAATWSDATSGIAEGSNPCNYTTSNGASWSAGSANGTHCYSGLITPNADITINFNASDKAGNSALGTSRIYHYDVIAPTCELSSIQDDSPYGYAPDKGNFFYNTAGSGNINITVNAIENGSGVSNVTFPLTEGLTGSGADTISPFNSRDTGSAYSWDSDSIFAGTLTLVCYDNLGNYATVDMTIDLDTEGPSGGYVTYRNGYYTTASVTIGLNAGTDGRSGLNTTHLMLWRQSATLSAGSCGGYGTWSVINSSVTNPAIDGTVVSGNCYKYMVQAFDNVYNNVNYTSANETKIDTSPPSCTLGSLAEDSMFSHVSGTTVYYNSQGTGYWNVTATTADSDSGINNVTFPALTGVTGSGSDTTTPYRSRDVSAYQYGGSSTYSASASFTCYSNSGTSASGSYTVTRDITAPSSGFVTYRDGYYTQANVTIGLSAGTDAGSGLNTTHLMLWRRSSTLTGGTCPSYGSWSLINSSVTNPATDLTVSTGNCYQYMLQSFDNVHNNVNYTSVNETKIDTSTPTCSITSVDENSAYGYVSGTTIWYSSNGNGGWNVTVSAASATSGISNVTFPALATITGSGADSTSTYKSRDVSAYNWTGSSTYSASASVTCYSNTGASATDTYTVTLDATAPSTTINDTDSDWRATDVKYNLTCSDGAGVGCAAIYYKNITGDVACTAGNYFLYTSTVSSNCTTGNSCVNTVCYYSVDRVNNTETVDRQVYRIDKAPLSCNINYVNDTSEYSHAAGTTVYYGSTGAGSFNVSVTASDAGSGIRNVTFETTVSAGGADSVTPYNWTYFFDTGDTYSGISTVTCYDNVSGSGTTTFTITRDTAAPSGGSINYSTGYRNSSHQNFSTGTDSGAGLNSSGSRLFRSVSPINDSNGCGSWSTYVLVGSLNPSSPYADATVTAGNCYQYRYAAYDYVMNNVNYSSSSVLRINNQPSQSAPTITPTNPNTSSNITCNWNGVTDPDSNGVRNITRWYKNDMPWTLLYLPFEGANANESTKVIDYSGFGNNGTVIGGNFNRTGGKVGGGYSFNRITDIDGGINLSNVPQLVSLGNFSIEFWMQTSDTSNQFTDRPLDWWGGMFVIEKDGISDIADFAVVVHYSKIKFTVRSDADTATSATTVSDGNWHHVVVDRHTNGTLRIFLDGSLSNVTLTTATGVLTNNEHMYIGSADGVGNTWSYNGSLDEIRVYNKTLSPAQVYQNYQDGLNNRAANHVMSSEMQLGEQWKCSVTSNDGYQDGNTLNSSSVTIAADNMVPYLTAFTLRPLLPNTTSILYCNATAYDAENTTLRVEYWWYNNSILHSGGNRSVQNNTNTVISALGEFNTTTGETWNCTVRVHDDTISAGYNSSTVTIVNVPPTITTPTFSPVVVNESSNINCNATVRDTESATTTVEFWWFNLTPSGYVLKLNGTKTGVSNNTNTIISTLGEGNTSVGETWNCTVRAYDGFNVSLNASATIQISNKEPNITTPILRPLRPNSLDDILCNATPTDAETSILDVEYAWYNLTPSGYSLVTSGTASGIANGTNATINTLSNSYTSDGETWNCTVRTYDGYGYSPYRSATVYIDSHITPTSPANAFLIDRDSQSADADFTTLIGKVSNEREGITVSFYANLTNPTVAGNSNILLGATTTNATGHANITWSGRDNAGDKMLAGNYTWWPAATGYVTNATRYSYVYGGLNLTYRNTTINPNSTYIEGDMVDIYMILQSLGPESRTQVNSTYRGKMNATLKDPLQQNHTIDLYDPLDLPDYAADNEENSTEETLYDKILHVFEVMLFE